MSTCVDSAAKGNNGFDSSKKKNDKNSNIDKIRFAYMFLKLIPIIAPF